MSDRREKLLAGLDLKEQVGVEIGALASPIVKRRDGRILYVDHLETAALRDKYRDHAGVEVNAIVDVDAVWGDRTIAEALGDRAPVDYVIASHVVEHVPDLVAWLEELDSILKPDGSIRLAVPDKRFCFDYLRSETRLSDVLAAHHARARRPQIRELIDSELYHRDIDPRAAWEARADRHPLIEHPNLRHAFAIADRAAQGEYIDVHCWTFTLLSFADLMQQLGSLELTRLKCLAHADTERNEIEFFVAMGRGSRDEVIESWGAVKAAIVGETAHPSGDAAQADRLLHKAQIEALHEELKAAHATVAELRASTSWKLTRPLRLLARLARGAAREMPVANSRS